MAMLTCVQYLIPACLQGKTYEALCLLNNFTSVYDVLSENFQFAAKVVFADDPPLTIQPSLQLPSTYLPQFSEALRLNFIDVAKSAYRVV